MGRMCSTYMQWIEKVWLPFCKQQGQHTYLINDEFKDHMQGKIVCHTQECGAKGSLFLVGIVVP